MIDECAGHNKHSGEVASYRISSLRPATKTKPARWVVLAERMALCERCVDVSRHWGLRLDVMEADR